jgi:hypothetical protein
LFDEDFFRSNHAGRYLSGPDDFKSKSTAVSSQRPIPESRYQANQYEAGVLNHREASIADSGHAVVAANQPPRAGAGNTSMLNQSLNSSIRMNRKTLEVVTPEIARQLERKNTGQSPFQSNNQPVLQQDQPGQETEDSVIEMNIDEEGYLLDKDGNYVLDDKGEPMKLTEEQIEIMRENGLYSEEENCSEDN